MHALYEECLAFPGIDDRTGIGWALNHQGMAHAQGDCEGARTLYEQA
jgi:hypothetical protein